MKLYQIAFGFFFILQFLGFINTVSAQILVSGSVKDGFTNESLVGVTIVIEGTTRGAITDINGNYSISVTGSDPVLVFSYVGYVRETIAIGDQRTINVSLLPDIESLGEVVITAQARGQQRAVQEQIRSNTLKNVVAPDRLQENPDANAVEAIGRLPGISLMRGGGEGHSLIIRGLEPRYASITLNNIQMSGTGGSGEANIAGISQYMLQGVEVYKALTPDMEANAVAGSVNLQIRETPTGLRYNILGQGGYNDLNTYFGNYKIQGEISNRLFNDRLGAFFSLNAESVNRGTQTMSAGYSSGDGTDVDILLNNVSLNQISTTKIRRNAMASFDYRASSSTKFSLYSMYSYTQDIHERQSKNYGTTGVGSIGYNFHSNPHRNTDIWHSAFSGDSKFNFIELDYGVAYSTSNMEDPDSRHWDFGYRRTPAIPGGFPIERRREHPEVVIAYYPDMSDSLSLLTLRGFGVFSGETSDKNTTAYMNAKVPYGIGDIITGYVKVGGIYRNKNRFQDFNSGGQNFAANQFGPRVLSDSISWLVRENDFLLGNGLEGYKIDNFLQGKYDFGWYYDFNRLNEISDVWAEVSEYYFAQGAGVWLPMFGEKSKIGYSQNVAGSMMDDQDINEHYGAGYLMTEINIGRYAMLLPGIRYEKTDARMKGMSSFSPTLPDPIYEQLPGDHTDTTRTDEFWLPMAHLRVRPASWAYIHFAYTNTISRPGFNDISPNTFINTGFTPASLIATNPHLKAERWENYDLQLTFHGNKIGLFSVSGFRKTVEDKIWHRGYTRLPGEPVVDPFPDRTLVNLNVRENHQYPISLTGLELELQTSFWYLPQPFNFFTLYANYTFTESDTQYPLSFVKSVVPPEGGRPVPMRTDTTTTGPMLHQPKHIANLSLGFNRQGLNVWLSFQYNGEIFTGYDRVLDMRDIKEHYYRWDMQVSQKLSGRFKGFEVLVNLANLSDYYEVRKKYGDPRPTYIENYGWTADIGIRYRFSNL